MNQEEVDFDKFFNECFPFLLEDLITYLLFVTNTEKWPSVKINFKRISSL